MPDFLLELRSEEIPARMQDKARDDLARLFAAELDKAGLNAAAIVTYATPRRLALIATDLPAETQAVSEETKGPKTSAPAQALEGFLRKTGLTQDQLEDRDGVYFAVVQKHGRATADVLAEAIPAIVRAFSWPKSMRWGAASASTESLRWVRPLQGIIALFGEDAVPCEVDGLLSGYQTLGHRFHHPGEITIGGAHDYVEKLRACHVIVDQDERRALIREGADTAAADAGLALVPDEGLVSENAGLTEWPVPMLGRFDPAFLEVPEEVIQLTARVNQKYFICRDAADPSTGSGLAPAFVCTANIDANDGGALVAGNEKVLAARLSDAKFFWEQDLKAPLEKQAEKLGQIVFHEKLGTVADKVERVAKLARWLCEEGIVRLSPAHVERSRDTAEAAQGLSTSLEMSGDFEALAALAERAAKLSKADLVTGMVGEFPELQGVMGGYLARAQGEPDAVADAIRDHYKPVGQGDGVPTAPVTVAVSLADKLDTIAGFFIEEMQPTGSRDPFALRRAALGVISLIIQNKLSIPLLLATFVAGSNVAFRQQVSPIARIMPTIDEIARLKTDLGWKQIFDPLIEAATKQANQDATWFTMRAKATAIDLLAFFADRLKVQQREAGVRHDLIDAVFSLGGEDDLVRLLARVKALQSFIEIAEGANLLAAYKRAANILKQAETDSAHLERSREAGVSTSLDMSGDGVGEPPVHDEGTKAPLASRKEQQIPQTGEEDPLSTVEEPGMAKAVSENPGRTEGTIPEGAEAADIALLGALDIAGSEARIAVDEERFGDAMAALAKLRAPIDRFFDEVMVNDNDPHKRAFRLGLLARFRDAVHAVADFSKIEG